VSRHKKSVSLGASLREAMQFLSDRTGQTETVLCALIVRMVVVCLSFQSIAQVSHDHAAFGAEMGWVARSIASGHGFSSPFFPSTGPTALMPPLFPYLLACVFRVCGVYTSTAAFVILSLDSFLSALTCIPIRMSLLEVVGERRAQLASWLWVIYPFAIYFSAVHVWDYALTSFLFATSFCFAQRIHLHDRSVAWCGFGLLCGLTVLSNPSVLSTLPFLFLIALLKVRCAGGRWLRCGVVFLLSMILVVAPWTIRNYLVMHAASPVRDGFWLEFWAGNAGDTSTSNPSWAHPASNPAEMQLFEKEGEAAYLAHKRSMALTYVGHHPVSFAVVTCRRAIRFWTGFWSVRSEYLYSEPLDIPNVFFCTSITFLMLRGIFRWWKEDRRELLPYLFLLIVFPIPYYLTHSSMDYRQPIEPQIIVLVTIGIFGFKDRIASADSPEVTTSRQYQAEPVMAYTSSRKSL
jgi:4-amino-4-deoxy-L-arabinose transferase-like glycosyltransferase